MDTVSTARATGAWYLALAVAGGVGFLLLRPLALDDPANTMPARLVVALELATVLTQAVTAVWFFRLLAAFNGVAAASVLGFGLAGAAAVLMSATSLGAASHVPAANLELLHALSDSAWVTGGLFFGLWLIPMGWAAVRSQRMPVALGWTLVVGGAGYIASTLVAVLWPHSSLTSLLTAPATVGEFWMITYLLVWGIRPRDARTVRSGRQ